jgi:hypothetical protein
MGKMLTVAAALVLAVVGAPLLAALVLAGATVPTAAAGRGDCALAVLAAGEWRPPFMQAYTVSSRGIGWSYHPVFKRWNFHGGQDMSSLPGPGPIFAANTGRVIRAGWDATGYGNTVDLRHAGGIQTRYAHLATIDPTIVPGATVSAGQRLGTEGTTGASTGNHLHFEVAVNGKRIDPITFMRNHHAPLDGRTIPAPSDPDHGAAAHAHDHRLTWQGGDPAGEEPRHVTLLNDALPSRPTSERSGWPRDAVRHPLATARPCRHGRAAHRRTNRR